MLKLAIILVIGVLAVVLYLILRKSLNYDGVDMPEAQERCKEDNDEMIDHGEDTTPPVTSEPKEEPEAEISLEDHSEISIEYEGEGEQFPVDEDDEGEIDLKEYFENELDERAHFQED